MSIKEKIHFYENKIDLKKVIVEQNLKDSDAPLYICDLSKIKEKYELWNKLLPRVKPYYATKCCNDPHVLNVLANLGTNFDCASKGEIKQILDMGVGPERIIYAHTCKMIPHIKYAKEYGVMTSTVDSECELYKIQKYFPESNILIRFRCDAKESYACLGEKFGCDGDREAPALMLLAKKLNLNVIGISFHVGSECTELPSYERGIAKSKYLFEYGKQLGFDMHVLDIGGGFSGTDNHKFIKVCEIVNESLNRYFPDNDVNIIAEPGRFFVATSMTLICKIHSKREPPVTNGDMPIKHYYLNDGTYGSFVLVMIAPNHTEIKHFVDEENSRVPKFKSILWGPTCDPADKIAENVLLPDLQCDDFIVFTNMGAYTIPVACGFNGFMSRQIIYYDKVANKRQSVYG
ncbi:ornithine decarboxylase 1-like [Haematobia irritans]|uniref:ornithine decarboxylase 1-like n=1 Tax=Haematobia irritans TaxID=7368 RepID=UPI003F50B383